MRAEFLTQQETYIQSLLAVEDDLKKQSRINATNLGLEKISINPAEAQLIKTLIRVHGCQKFVEIGTLTGLSAQYIFEGLAAGGCLWTLEKDPEHAELAAQVFAKIPQQEKTIRLVLGDAREELKKISTEGPFDGIFIDGNKAAYGDYLQWALENLRPGGLVLADNIFLNGAVWGEPALKFSAKQIRIMQEFNHKLADPTLFDSAVVPTFEGLYVAIKK